MAGRLGAVALVLAASWCASAHAAPPACRVEPFAEESVGDRESALNKGCGGEHLAYQLDTPKLRPMDTGPSQLNAQVDASVTEPLSSQLATTLRFVWAGQRSDEAGRLQAQRSMLGAGTVLKLNEDLALQASVGHDVIASRNRATVAGIWQPTDRGLAFAEWSAVDDRTEAHRVGARLWVLPKRMSLDIATKLPRDSVKWEDPRIGFTLDLTPR